MTELTLEGTEPADAVAAVPLAAALEAVLMVADTPVELSLLASLVGHPVPHVERTLRALQADYLAQERGFELREIAGGWRFYTAAHCAPVVQRYVLDGQLARLSQAALETLTVVAYRQPVARGRVSAIRGVNCDGVMRTLVGRGLVEEAGSEDSGAVLYRTTTYFLERLGLRSVEQLPPLAPHLPDLDTVEDEP